MATRLGKTITAALDVQRYLGSRRAPVLYLCHKTDILYQAQIEFERVFGTDRTYGFFHGSKKDFGDIDILFCSFDTLANWLDMFDPGMFEYIIVDESHHSHAETYLPTIQYFKPKFLLGITATPNRMDQKDITDIYGQPVYNLPLEKALALGYLTPVDYRILTDEIQMNGIVETPDKKWSISALNRQIFVPKRDEEIARLIAEYTRDVKDLKMIVFCSSVKYCDRLVTLLPESLSLHSRIPQKERNLRLEMFRQRMLSTVVTVDCFNEGIDIPRANVIVFLRSTESLTIFLQQLGRGLTKEEGKERVLVLDFVANIQRIQMVNTLAEEVARQIPPTDQRKATGVNTPLTVDVGKVSFHEQRVTMNDLLDKILKKDPYLTWQEASAAAIRLDITSGKAYPKLYKKDGRLPSTPREFYEDFPGWGTFLSTGRIRGSKASFYVSCDEASAAARKLGISRKVDYLGGAYKKDSKLPACPNETYPDFPGWGPFLGDKLAKRKPGDVFELWIDAAKAAQDLGIKSHSEYSRRYRENAKLPSNPFNSYPDFPGWPTFLGKV